jgi:Phage integrase family
MTLALNTTMRASEIKGLRWQDVNFTEEVLAIRRSKTAAGDSVIPLNTDAKKVILELWDRAKELGGNEPDHFVFPGCESGRIDPSVPQKSWRTAWRSLRKEAGLPGLRFHDLRHQAITELAESMTSDQTIMSIAGHVSRQMLEHYSHVRLAAKRQALEALSSKPPAVAANGEASYDTKNVTNDKFVDAPSDVSVRKKWSGRVDLNHRPPGPEPGALARSRTFVSTSRLRSKRLRDDLGCVRVNRKVRVCS